MMLVQAAGKIFKARGKGNLIVTASVSSIVYNFPQEQAAYNASMFGHVFGGGVGEYGLSWVY